MRDKRFTFVCNREERMMLEALASRRQRTKSDAIRMLIRQAYGEIKFDDNRIHQDQERKVKYLARS